MPILRDEMPRKNYLKAPKIFLQDNTLSLVERGLLATLYSLPEDWVFTVEGMRTILPDGNTRIKAALNGLILKGYVIKIQSRECKGKYGGNDIRICDDPGKVKALSDKPSTENPSADNMPLYITNRVTPDGYNTNPSINQIDDGVMDAMSDSVYESVKAIIADNIELDSLKEKAALTHDEDEIRMVQDIYDLICDMVCYERKPIVIKGTKYPWIHVKEQFLKLRYCHIADILNRIVDSELGIRNMHNYLISTLYTASLTGVIADMADMHDVQLKAGRGKPYE